jgi:diguanylate cyclase (GGDEF)-like protein
MSETALARENRELRLQLQALLANARQNEQILRRQQEQELCLLGVGSLGELLRQLLEGYRRAGELDAVTLAVVDPEYEILHMLSDAQDAAPTWPGLLLMEDNCELAQLFGTALAPRLGAFDEARHGLLFPGRAMASVALLPLVRRQQLIGAIGLGSLSRGRFVAGMGTDFIHRMGGIVAISLENVLNGERLRRFGLTDALTGVHNRRYFEQRLLDEVERVRRHHEALSCLFLDVDHFKRINDSYGHQAGDLVLREVARRIRAEVRSCDVVVRYGGEEFAVLLVRTEGKEALPTAERIRQAMCAQPFEIAGHGEERVSVSVGVAAVHGHTLSGPTENVARLLVERADQAVYRAKGAGRNRVEAGC